VIKYGHIDVDIHSDELSKLNFIDLHECYRQYDTLNLYYNKYNSSVWQMFDEDCPSWIFDIAKQLVLQTKETVKYVVSIIKLEPGNTVPNHVDAHFKVQEQFGKGKTARYLIMLEDWKLGHYYEIHNQPFVKWRKGDWVLFGQEDWHLAGNMGDEPFYSMQVTVKYD
jgi:hypothetical protein